MLIKQAHHRHYKSRSAEPALQAVGLVEGLLNGMERGAVRGQALDGRDLVALRLDGEHQAGADRHAVEKYRAAPAHAVLAADVRTGEAEVVPQVIGQQPARVACRRILDRVDLHAAKARSVSTRTRCRRNSGVASRSPLGCRPRVGSPRSAITGVPATPNSASLSPARTTPASAKSPWRRDSSRIACLPPKAGNHVSSTSSSGAIDVSKTPRNSSSAPMIRRPRAERATTWPPSASRTAGSSEAGSA